MSNATTARACRRLVGLLVFSITWGLGGPAAQAGSRFIGNVSVPAGTGALSGIAFDDFDAQRRPLVGKSTGEAFRINLTTAAIETRYTLPASNTVRGLAYRGQGAFFQTQGQPGTLYTINPVAGTAQASPSTLGAFYNFLDLAIDARTGQLWASTDQLPSGFGGGGSLYTANPSTGALSLVTRVPGVGQLTSLAIGPNGEVFAAGLNSVGVSSIYRVNPASGASILATTLNTPTGYLTDFAYRPDDGRWYGLFYAFDANQYQFVEITNLPEPSLVVVGVAVAVLGRRRW